MKKILISGIVAGIAAFIVGSLLYMNPLVSDIYAQYANYPCSKSMELFGGTANWMLLMFLGGVISTVFLAALYAYAEKSIGIKPAWKKGAFFGILLWFVSKLPSSYYIWLLYSYPDILNIIETINGLIGGIVAGVVLAIVYEKLGR